MNHSRNIPVGYPSKRINTLILTKYFNGYRADIDERVFPSFRADIDQYTGRIYIVFDGRSDRIEFDFAFRAKCMTNTKLAKIPNMIDRWIARQPLLNQLIKRFEQPSITHSDITENIAHVKKPKKHRTRTPRLSDQQRFERSERIKLARRAARQRRVAA